MANVCYICNKERQTGSKVSHSNRHSNRRWNPNIKRVKAVVDGSPKRIYVCTRCLRSGKVVRSVQHSKTCRAKSSRHVFYFPFFTILRFLLGIFFSEGFLKTLAVLLQKFSYRHLPKSNQSTSILHPAAISSSPTASNQVQRGSIRQQTTPIANARTNRLLFFLLLNPVKSVPPPLLSGFLCYVAETGGHLSLTPLLGALLYLR